MTDTLTSFIHALWTHNARYFRLCTIWLGCVDGNTWRELRVRFFEKIQDLILKSERIRKWILRFFARQINPRSLGSSRVKGTEESTSRGDSSVPLTHHDPRDPKLIYLVKKRKIHFRILSDLRIQSWIFSKKRTLRCLASWTCIVCGEYIVCYGRMPTLGNTVEMMIFMFQVISVFRATKSPR